MADGNYIAYYRVSTDRQGQSGLGLEAQQKAVEDYLNGGEWELVGEFTEIESGKRSDRPELAEALKACKKHRATLVIAKLDRLARNVYFVSGLMESGVEFVAADNPHANKLMVHMLAAFAEHERDQISQRTKAALAAAKARGVELGKHGKVLAREHRIEADRFAAQIAPTVSEMKRKGMSIRAMTETLNEKGVPTAKGGKWHVPTTHRLLKRIERLTQEDAA
jgi:DNA invertase Pin-like site-specific DNA recombinase